MHAFQSRVVRSCPSVVAAAPAVLIIFVCGVMPLAWMAGVIVANPDVRRELAFDDFRVQLMVRTLGYNGAVAIIATLMGLPAGFVLGRGRGLAAKVLWVVLPAALLLPSLAYAYGWKQFIQFFIMPVPGETVDILRCIWSLAAWLWAVPAGLIGLALRRTDPAVQQQALMDGALRRFTFRQLLGPILASMAIVTVLASQEFSVYEPTGISVVATEVRMVFDTGSVSSDLNMISGPMSNGEGKASPDQPARAAAAITTAIPLLIVTTLLAIAAAWGARRAGASEALSVGDWPRVLDTSAWTVGLTLILVAVNIGVPVVSLFAAWKIHRSPAIIFKQFGPQLGGAMFIGSIAAVISMIAALSAAARWVRGFLAIASATFLIGGQVLAIALIRIYNRPGLDWAYDIWVVPAIAYVGRFGWLAMAAGRGAWSPPWKEMRDVASTDGANTLQTAFGVVWPIAWPMLAAGGLLVGALSLTEVPATVLLMPQQPQVLTPMLMTWVHMNRSDPMIEASLLMMATVLVPGVAGVLLTTLGLRIARRGLGRGAA